MKILAIAFALSVVALIWLSEYQAKVIDQQETIILQLMAPEPHLPPSPPVGIETPKRRQLDTPAPTEQNFV